MNYRLGISTLSLALLAGCGSLNWWSGPKEQSRIPRDATLYQCEAGKQLGLRFDEGGKSVMVVFPEREFRLNQVDGSAGARYSNGRTTLNLNGDEATLSGGDVAAYAGCKKT